MGIRITALKELCTSDTQIIILQMLAHTNKSRRVTKKELMDVTHLDSRKVRLVIQQMRANGIPIAADMEMAGYYIPRSWNQYKDFAKRYTGRAYTTIQIEALMTRNARLMFGDQVEMDLHG